MAWFWQKQKDEESRKEQQAAAQEKRGKLGGTAVAEKPSKKPEAKKSAAKSGSTASADRVLLGPVVTEKAARLAESGTYVFAVAKHAGKIDIARAVSELYDVHPTSVAVLNSQRKPKVFAQRYGRRASLRKAYVTLKAGETIELFKQ
jgi:large subunit ribosomal protein L23